MSDNAEGYQWWRFGGLAATAPPPVFRVALFVGASYLDPLSTYGPSTFTTAVGCSRADGGVCAWEAADGGVFPAGDDPDGGPRFQTRAVHRIVADRDEEWIMIASPNGGQEVNAYNSGILIDGLDAAAAWAASQGRTILPVVLVENSGGYANALDGDSFATYQAEVEAFQAAIESHISTEIGSATAGWSSLYTGLALIPNGGGAQYYGVSGIARHPYAPDFPGWGTGDPDVAIAGQFYFVETGADQLHPDVTGANAIGELYAHVIQVVVDTGDYRPLTPTSVTVVDEDTITATFFAPCRARGTCAVASPTSPIALNTTDVVAQECAGVVTYGWCFYLAGVLVTPGGAVSAVTPASCPAPQQTCDVTFDFAAPIGDFDEVSFGDTGVVNTPVDPTSPDEGGTNVAAARTDHCGTDTCTEFALGAVFPSTLSRDGGVPDSGASDSGPSDSGVADSGPSDSGVADSGPADSGVSDAGPSDAGSSPDAATFASAESVEFNASGGNLSLAVSSGALDDLDGHTVLYWISNPGLFEPGVSRWGSGGASTEQWWFGVVTGNANNGSVHWAIGLEAGGGAGMDCGGTMTAGWDQVGFSYDGATQTVHCFEDGAFNDGTTVGTIPTSLNDEDQPISIGLSGHQSDVDAVSYFSCALTEAEALQVYCSTHGASGDDNSAACATASGGGGVVDEDDFGEYVLGHPCFLMHCDFEDTASGGNGFECWNATLTENGTPTYTSSQP
ncbi:MAG: hypothetical protein RMA76_38100 [Deltaproteobacteria bacterium]